LKPLLYLELRQFLNALKNTTRSPRRLVLALIIGACFFSWFLNTALLVTGASPVERSGFSNVLERHAELFRVGAFLLLCFGSAAVIYQAFSSGSLVFTMAHIDFLFPTPIPRRSVLLVKLLKDYLRYGFWIAFLVTCLGMPTSAAAKQSFFPYGLLSIAALTAYMIFIVNLAHTINIVFTFGYEKVKQAGRIIKPVLILAAVSALVLGVFQYIQSGGDCYLSIHRATTAPVVKVIFTPADWCASLAVAPLIPPADTDLMHLALLWALAAAAFAMLMSRRENIYEPSLGITAKVTRMRQAMRAGDATAIRVEMMSDKGRKSAGMLVIPPFGRGAVALLWKGLLTRYRMSAGQLAAMLVLPALLCYLLGNFDPISDILKYLPVILVYLSFVFSITVQPQVRSELKYANILKAMPIAPWKVMLVQSISGTGYLSLGILTFAAAMWLFMPAARNDVLRACVIVSPFLGFSCISAAVIPALTYPDTRDTTQNFFCNLVGFALIIVAAVPSIVLGTLLVWLTYTPSQASPIIPLWITVPLCAVNLLIGAAGVSISGAVFRKFDPTSE